MEVEYVIGLSGTFAHALPTTYNVHMDTHTHTFSACARTHTGHDVMTGSAQTSCLLKLLDYLKNYLKLRHHMGRFLFFF